MPAAWESLGHAAVDHQADAGVDADQADGSVPEPGPGFFPQHLKNASADGFTEQTQPDWQQEHSQLCLHVPAER